MLQKWADDWQMPFNFTNNYYCEFLRITKKHPVLASYKIGECIKQEVPYIKYLGVTNDSQLMWNEHIKIIIKKANTVKDFLHWNISSCPTRVKLNCYKMNA